MDPPHQNNPNQIDDIRDLRRAIALMQAGQYREAIRLFRQVIADDPRSMDAVVAARYILGCYAWLGEGFDEARGVYNRMMDDYGDSPLGNVLRMQIPMTLVQERRYEEARDAFVSLSERAPRAVDRVFAEICAREIEYQVLDGDRVNSVGEISRQRAQIDSLTMLLSSLDRELQSEVPAKFELVSVYPNPFNSKTTVKFNLDWNAKVTLSLYDVTGREAYTIQTGQLHSGSHRVILEGSALPAGVYLLKLKADERTTAQKVVLVK